ncbi:MAG: heavy metal resistance protein CzcA [Acidobacteria bacterium 13_1_40CM_65_14]|nr:MAG: heavy metal resistance protein CzcA [Acidobacteria bacterium 13_1_40CM_65_14]OLC80055.1 MAG: heavy metal resistance protein CzcA [Acidobacteria bacterium 13_1_40CM_4_65_8]OLD18714.1 MAG: heavy metal resistance protein CzcA [Acidobacteria bacterium 13_1_40CM_3_65_5]OLE85473.1 MAG: heavy metal resistance protein CzcA [Acidobacteria bacterium 13_1_20CM_2_65_9]
MVRRLVSFALYQPLFLALITVLFIASGIVAFRSLPVEAFPDVADVQATVITLVPGHAAEEVEKQVTIPLEIALAGVPHSVRMFSHTQFGLSYLTVTFDDQVDDYFARQRVLERLQQADLPPDTQPQLAPLSTPVGELYRYRLVSDTASPTDLRGIEDWVVERNLKMAPGVADVVGRGGFIKQYQVNVDLARMRAYGVGLQQVFTALGRGNANAGGNYLEQGEQQYLIRGVGLLRSADDIGSIVVAEHGGTPLLIRDIADVRIGAVPRQGLVGRNDEDEIVEGIVLMRKGENPSEVLDEVKSRVEHLNASVLPEGVRIVPYYDRSRLIATTLTTVFRNLLEGALLVTLVLYIFLRNGRAAGIVAAVIPLALLSTFIGLRIRGIPANLLSLGAMDFGIIVDGAVIVVENVFRTLAEHGRTDDRESVRGAILDATVQVGRPTLFSMLIIIVAHIPIFTLQRHEGRIFAPMAYTVTSALVGSLIFSLTLVPLLCFWLLGHGAKHEHNRLVEFLTRVYRRALDRSLRRPALVIGAAVAGLVAALALVPRLGTEFLPELNEGTLWVNLTLPSSVSVSEASRIVGRVRSLLRRFPEVTQVISQAGRPEDGTDPKPINMCEFFVDLKAPGEWTRNITREELAAQMEDAINEIPGLEPAISQPIRDNVLESISQIDGQIVIKVFGDDAATLRQKANDVLHAVSGVRGVSRAFIDRAGEVPQLQIQVDRGRAARYGLNVADVEDVIETAIGGKVATEIWESDRRYGVAVRLREEDRKNMAAIRDVLVDTPSGARVPLADVADISVRGGSMNISREAGLRVSAIGVFIRGRDMGGIVAEMRDKVARGITFPPGYYATFGGEFENQQRAMTRLAVIVPVSVFLIFILLFDAFGSVKNASIILVNIPLASIGGIVALYLTGIHVSVSAAIGFIALFGQAVLNGVVMVSYFADLRAQGLSPRDAVTTGATVRLRTVLMTALLAMLGLMPMALSHSIGSEVQKPLAVVVIGGLVSATLLTLLVLPTLYLLVEERGALRAARR